MDQNEDKARRILNLIRMFTDDIAMVDAEQVGDHLGLISPIKHEIRDVLTPLMEKLRVAARTYFNTPAEGA